MRNPISYLIFFIIVSVGHYSTGQNLELAEPNKNELREAYQNDKNGFDIIYHYLVKNYKSTSEKTKIRRLDYDEFKICAFEQEFEHGIKFSTESCQEAGGISIKLEFPKIGKQEIKSWVEKIYDADLSDIPNEWYKEKNIYGPVGGEAGCYYELKEFDKTWVIDIYCGC